MQQRGEVRQQWLPTSLPAPLWSEQQPVIRTPIFDIWRRGSFLSLQFLQAVCKLLQEHVPAQLPPMWLGVGSG